MSNLRSATFVERRGPRADQVWLPWIVGWLGGSVLAIANGVVRELVYKDRVGELPAHYLSTAGLMALLALYMRPLDRRWPIPDRRTAVGIGGGWLALTVLFEFGFGHYVDGYSWSKLLKQYDVSCGNVWVLVLLWTALGPAVVRALRTRDARS